MLAHSRSHVLLRDLMTVSDVMVLFVSASIASWLRFDHLLPSEQFLLPTLSAPLFYLAAMMVLRGYHTLNPQTFQMGAIRLCCAQATSLAILLALAYFSKVSDEFSRLWTGYFVLTSTSSLILLRFVTFTTIRMLGYKNSFLPKVTLIGINADTMVLNGIEKRVSASGYRVAQVPIEISGSVKEQHFQTALETVRKLSPDVIVLVFGKQLTSQTSEFLDSIDAMSADILEVRETYNFNALNQSDFCLSHLPTTEWTLMAGLPFIYRAARPFGQRGWWIKRTEDLVLGTAAIIILTPIMIAIATLVKLTSVGPVFFIQNRHGFNGEPIRVLKFRSMHLDHCSTDKEEEIKQATKGDSRITPLGAVLRRTSLDELPQLFNVLRGDMSLVGPRPHATQHNTAYRMRIDGYFARHRVKPGITGWAQVNGLRGEIDSDEKMQRRVIHDMYYINNWSPFFDLKILLMTIIYGIYHKNAY